MSNQNNTRILLNIKDNSIHFSDESVKQEVIKGVLSHVVYATHSPEHPDFCTKCGCINQDNSIIKNGTKSVTIKLPKCSNFTTYLKLKKQRYYCKMCSHTFISQTNLVDKNCSISKNTYHKVLLEIKTKRSVWDISKSNNISHTTINSWISNINSKFIQPHNALPKNLSFDEFKSVKEVKGKMSFIFTDADTGKILDILTHRHIGFLKSYFFSFPLDVRKQVETVSMDMFKGYIDLVKSCFPTAKIITDRFHVVQLINRSFNSVRTQIMKEYKQYYSKLKKYWKLLMMTQDDLDDKEYKHFKCFPHLMTEQQVVDELLRSSKELEECYWLMQRIRLSINNRQIDHFEDLISKNYKHLPKTIQTTINTFNYHKTSILNALTYEYSNGKLEGTNNLIKVIKRIAFGYRSFTNFRARVLLISNTMLPLQL